MVTIRQGERIVSSHTQQKKNTPALAIAEDYGQTQKVKYRFDAIEVISISTLVHACSILAFLI